MKIQISLLVAIVVLFVMVMASPQINFPLRIVHHSSSSQSQVRKAKVKLIAAGGTGKAAVYGLLKLTETSHGVYIRGKILGLEAGNHGFHVHEIGDTGNSCDNAGPHFNPEHNTHGRQNPKDGRNRHVGDLGNLFTQHSHEPITEVTILDTIITLDKTKSNGITGRTFVVHAFEDDLGKGGDEESLRTGNAGDRLACGIVVPENY